MGRSADDRLLERSRRVKPAQAVERTAISTDAGGDSGPQKLPPVEPCDMTLEQLFQRFEKDLIYDAHGVVARYSRSSARKEIQKRATASVVEDQSFLIRLEIVRYLRSGKSLGEGVFQEDVETGWAGLLGAISRRESAF